MDTPQRTTAIAQWLAGAIAAVEAELQGQGATCTLDRQHASPPGLKYREGRYALLRRARRLVERGDSLLALHAEADKAHAFLAGGGALSVDAQWQAYQQGVLDAVHDVLARVADDARRRWPST